MEVIDAPKSSNAALIGGLVGGMASIVLLIVIAMVLWRTRSNSMRGGLPVSRPGAYIQHSPSMSTSNNGSRTLHEIGRIGTLSSSISAVEVGTLASTSQYQKAEP